MFKKESRLYTILTVILWTLGALTLWEFVYELSHMVGAIVCGDIEYTLIELFRMMPHTLTMITYIFSSVILHSAFISKDIESRIKRWRTLGIFTVVMGFIIIIYIFVGLGTGRYLSLVEGSPTALFPLDIMLGGILFIAFGFYSNEHSGKIKEFGSEIGYSSSKMNPLFGIVKIFCFLGFLISSCGFAAAFYGTYVLDWAHGRIFFNIMLWLNYFTAPAMYFVYRFICLGVDNKNENKDRDIKKYSLLFLIINIVLMILYEVSVQIYPEAPNQNAFGLFPNDFIASVNVFPLIYAANNILTPAVSLIISSIHPRKK